MSTLKTDTLSNTAGSKTVPVNTVVDGSAKAWVNFNGTGTVAIRKAFNVSSITDSGVGEYTLNFTSPMSDANYAAVGSCSYDSNDAIAVQTNVYTTTTLKVGTVKANLGAFLDKNIINVAIFS